MADYSDYDYDDYDYDDYDNDDDYYDGPHHDGVIPCPEPTIRATVQKWWHRLQLKIYLWRHRDESSDIPF